MGGDIYYVRKDPAEKAFSAPLKVNGQNGSAIAKGTMRGPQIAIGKAGRVHVSWMGGEGAQKVRIGKTDQTAMLYARLSDDKTSFEPEKAVNKTIGGLDGGGTVAADSNGNVWVIWHGVPPDIEGEENRALYVAHSLDEGRTFQTEFKGATPQSGACACCGMKAFAGKDGKLYVLYRGVQEKLNRPEVCLVSDDAGHTFKPLYTDLWKTATCPASTVSFQQGNANLFAAWETDGNVFAATIHDGRETNVMAPQGDGKRKFPFAIENGKGEVLLTWVEGAGWEKAGTVAWEIFKNGKTTGQKGVGQKAAVWSFAQAYQTRSHDFVIVY
jgi:hypothetical protein